MAPTGEKAASPKESAILTFKKHGGILRKSEAIEAGVHPATPYSLLREGRLKRLSRGEYSGSQEALLSATRIL